MKQTLLTAVLCALTLSTCANDNQTFALSSFYPLVACARPMSTGTSRIYAPNGTLDVAAGDAQFFIGASVDTTSPTVIASTPVLFQDGTTAAPAANNRPVVTEYVVTYTLSKRLGQRTPAPFVVPYRFDLTVNNTNTVNTIVQLISSEMAQTLYDGLTPADGTSEADFVDVECAVEFRGEYSATRTPFTTGQASFNVRAYRSTPSGAACAAGQRYPRYIDSSGAVDTCSYSGQSGVAGGQPLPPSEASCCDPATTEGC